jgi:hypothetical protein
MRPNAWGLFAAPERLQVAVVDALARLPALQPRCLEDGVVELHDLVLRARVSLGPNRQGAGAR